jgi:hypothetical protein
MLNPVVRKVTARLSKVNVLERYVIEDSVDRMHLHELVTGIQTFQSYEYRYIIPANTW